MSTPLEPTDIPDLEEGIYPVPFFNTRIFPILRALLPSSEQKIHLDGGGNGGECDCECVGGTPGVETTVNVPASRQTWTDSCVTMDSGDVVTVAATGLISHIANYPAYGPDTPGTGVSYLVMCVVADGETPAGYVADQQDYRVGKTIASKTGRVWARIADGPDDYGDNYGSFDVTLTKYSNASGIVGPPGPPGPPGVCECEHNYQTGQVDSFSGEGPSLSINHAGMTAVDVDWTVADPKADFQTRYQASNPSRAGAIVAGTFTKATGDGGLVESFDVTGDAFGAGSYERAEAQVDGEDYYIRNDNTASYAWSAAGGMYIFYNNAIPADATYYQLGGTIKLETFPEGVQYYYSNIVGGTGAPASITVGTITHDAEQGSLGTAIFTGDGYTGSTTPPSTAYQIATVEATDAASTQLLVNQLREALLALNLIQ